jgi:hypothetical protein
MARVGEEFPLACPACGGDIRLIAFITDPGPIRKRLTHLGESLEPPPLAPARARSSRDSRVAHQPEDRCRSAIDRAILHAKDEVSREFYERFDFLASPTDPLHLFLLMKDLRLIVGTRS